MAYLALMLVREEQGPSTFVGVPEDRPELLNESGGCFRSFGQSDDEADSTHTHTYAHNFNTQSIPNFMLLPIEQRGEWS